MSNYGNLFQIYSNDRFGLNKEKAGSAAVSAASVVGEDASARTPSLFLCHSCHPSVTPDSLRKGCKRPVHRRSGTLSPFNKEKSQG